MSQDGGRPQSRWNRRVARSRGFPARRDGPRRQVTWIAPADQSYVSVSSGQKVIVGSFDPSAAGFAKPTVVRSRGLVSIKPTSIAASLTMSGAWGIGVVSQQAFAAGLASIPGPFTDAQWDGWFAWGAIIQHFAFHSGVAAEIDSVEHVVDSKAMRKISQNEIMILMVESQGGAFDIGLHVRTLFKLS